MALNKRRTQVTAPVSSEVTPQATSPNSTPDLGALQAALASIVQLVTEQASKLSDLTSELESIKARLDAVEAAMDEDDEDGEDTDEDTDEDDEDEYTADDIDPMKVNEQLHQFDANEQKEILSIAMKSLGTNRLNPRIIAKDANAAYAVAEVLCSEKFGCDVEDMVKD